MSVQDDPEEAYSYASKLVDEVALSKGWDSSWRGTAIGLVDKAYEDALVGSWFESDSTTTEEFWTALGSSWKIVASYGTTPPKGWTDLQGVWSQALHATNMAKSTSVTADDAIATFTETAEEGSKAAGVVGVLALAAAGFLVWRAAVGRR